MPQRKVSVTQEHITDSMKGNSSHCMIAEAIKDRFPNLKRVAVDIQTIRATDPVKDKRYIWLTPAPAQRAIIDFDEGRPPQPFKFNLRGGQVIAIERVQHRDTKKRAAKIVVGKGLTRKRKPDKDGNIQPSAMTMNGRLILGGTAPPISKLGGRRQFGLSGFRPRSPGN